MKTCTPIKKSPGFKRLVCCNCGNTHRFIEVMAEEAHIVDGDLNYIRLLEAFTDHYICCECDETIPAELIKNPNPIRLKGRRLGARQSKRRSQE